MCYPFHFRCVPNRILPLVHISAVPVSKLSTLMLIDAVVYFLTHSRKAAISHAVKNITDKILIAIQPQNHGKIFVCRRTTGHTFLFIKYFIYTIEFTTGTITNRHTWGEEKYKSEYTKKRPCKDEKIA